jgi:hypothetical protein
MNWIDFKEKQPAIGERVLIDTGSIIVAAKLMIYLHVNDLYWINDLGSSHQFETIIRWANINS